MTPRFAAAISAHPVPAHATGEVVGRVLEAMGDHPDVAFVFVTPPHAGALEDIAAAVRAMLRPAVLAGAASRTAVGDGREVEGDAAVVLWAGRVGPARAVRLETAATPDGPALLGLPDDPGAGSALVVLADPFTFSPAPLLARTRMPVVGGMVAAAQGPGGNRLVLDGAVHHDGATGVLLGPGVEVVPVVSQGCRPVGEPFAVTKARGDLVEELGGRPALARLEELFRASGAEDRSLLAAGVLLGVAVDEHRDELGAGDFLVRPLRGADRTTGALALADPVPVGTTVQFHVRDANAAGGELRALLAGHDADAALLFTGTGRGTALFGEPDHDAQALDAALGVPVAGMGCAGEIGPLGGVNRIHEASASIALVRARP